MINLNKVMLQQTIDQCSSITMNNNQMQFALLKICTYLKKNQEGKEVEKCKEWKEYVDKQIDKVEQTLSRKLIQINKVENRIGDLCDNIQQMHKVTQSQQQQQNRISNTNQKLTKEIEGLNNQISQMGKYVRNKIQDLNIEIQKLSEIKPSKDYLFRKFCEIQKQSFIQKWDNKFNFDGKTLTKISNNQQWHQHLFFKFIPHSSQFKFKVKIVKQTIRAILIGVVDYDKQKQQQSSYNSNNAVCYHAFYGSKYPDQINQGNGVNVGETVEVKVDRKNKTIRWIVNNIQIASHVHNMLGEENRKFMPYVEMKHVGDTIEYNL